LDIQTHSFQRQTSRIAGVVLMTLIMILAGARLAAAQDSTQTKPAAATTKAKPKKPATQETFGAPVKSLGNPSAPITLEVFSDYMCPQCRNFYMNTLTVMIQDYVAAGKVNLVHRDFPLPIPQHKYNWDAARWGTAAARIGKFEVVDNALYINEPAWEADGDIQKIVAGVLSPAELKRVQKQVAPCLTQTPANLRPTAPAGESCSLDAYINQDVALAKAVPVNSTPTMVITYKGRRYPPTSGFISWPILKQFFDSLLSQ
jgi:protein-disulfide isomerase